MNDDDLDPAADEAAAPDAAQAGEAASDAEEAGLDAERVSRRSALKKAAAGAATMGAVWAGPRVEGLSLVPDYASAGTVHGLTKSFTIDSGQSDGPFSVNSDNGGAGTGCDGGVPPIYGNDWAAVSPASNPGITVTSPQPNARNNTINMTYPLPANNTLHPGPAGTVNALIPAGWDADLNVNRTVTMSFALNEFNNKCRIQSATGNRCDGSGLTVTLSGNPAPGAVNPAPFSVNVIVPGPQPSNMAQLRIVVECT